MKELYTISLISLTNMEVGINVTLGVMYYHGPTITYLNFFKIWVHDSTRGVEGYLMNFHGPTITYLKFFKTLVHDST